MNICQLISYSNKEENVMTESITSFQSLCSGSPRSESSLELQKNKIKLNLWARMKKTGYFTTLYLITSARDKSTRM